MSKSHETSNLVFASHRYRRSCTLSVRSQNSVQGILWELFSTLSRQTELEQRRKKCISSYAQALQLSFQEVATVEPKESARSFMRLNASGEHNFLRLEDWVQATDELYCSIHDRPCELPLGRTKLLQEGF